MVDHGPDDFCQRRIHHPVAGGLKNCINARCILRSRMLLAICTGFFVNGSRPVKSIHMGRAGKCGVKRPCSYEFKFPGEDTFVARFIRLQDQP